MSYLRQANAIQEHGVNATEYRVRQLSRPGPSSIVCSACEELYDPEYWQQKRDTSCIRQSGPAGSLLQYNALNRAGAEIRDHLSSGWSGTFPGDHRPILYSPLSAVRYKRQYPHDTGRHTETLCPYSDTTSSMVGFCYA